MKKRTTFIFLFIINILVLVPLTVYLASSFFQTSPTMWKYQCVDTMKISRDEARSLLQDKNAEKEIAKEMTIIKSMGANCVAIGTPYDEEFFPILSLWVQQARIQHLHIWFRGNFSAWEGWFGYQQGMSTQDLLDKTKEFIQNHQDLFVDGDIFTPAPEAENGWPGNYVPQSDYPVFRQFLINEYQTSQSTFTGMNKHVDTWLSMSGGLARGMLDENTIRATGNKVTIDHYVHSPQEMADYVAYFYNHFGAQVIIGEFGAPIPDINGDMSDKQQAQFINNVFYELYKQKGHVYGVNYWVLDGGSTSLLGNNSEEKPAAKVLASYFKPTQYKGRIIDEVGNAINGAIITTSDNAQSTKSDANGQFAIDSPKSSIQILASKSGYIPISDSIFSSTNGNTSKDIVLQLINPDPIYQFRLKIKNILQKIHIFTNYAYN